MSSVYGKPVSAPPHPPSPFPGTALPRPAHLTPAAPTKRWLWRRQDPEAIPTGAVASWPRDPWVPKSPLKSWPLQSEYFRLLGRAAGHLLSVDKRAPLSALAGFQHSPIPRASGGVLSPEREGLMARGVAHAAPEMNGGFETEFSSPLGLLSFQV